jgi:uncharacterized protein DUF4839/PASTA domain-containing protein
MRALRWAVALLFVLGLAACGPHKNVVMPDVTGKKLDVAKNDIKQAGVGDKVKVVGGGLLGVIVDSDWEVCDQSPAPGQAVSGAPQLAVGRSCDNSATVPASPSGSDSPPSAESSPALSAGGAPLTAENNKDFAALLADPAGDCDNRVEEFAKKYSDRAVEFDGTIASMVNHGADKTIWDILLNAGKAGPNFEFAGVSIYPGDNAPGELNLPASSAMPTQGDKLHVVAKVDHFNAIQCLLFLTPVSTTVTK